jgi:flagellar M-ring protein FliF
MDSAVATPAQIVPDSFATRWKAIPLGAKASFAIGLLALAAVVWALVAWGNKGDYKVLYANLADKDAGAVVAQLSTLNVPFRFSEGGSAILVPAASVHDLRLKMATAGLPKGTVNGFELMDTARFGQTQFQERLTFQRGLEGELVRSISSIGAVQSARVHLALPSQNGFFREQQKPSASVVLGLHPGRSLDAGQLAGIVHLVASSVPELAPKAVAVLDQSGALLTGDGSAGAALDAQQLRYVAQVEGNYRKRIADLIEPLVGADNLRATVTADIDFTQAEATTEEFKPNQGAEATASIRSQQTVESGGAGGSAALPSGVPGASSNQPPVAATAPITGASQPLQGSPSGSGGAVGAGGRRDAVTNYELDRTVRVTRAATGTVKRINAAVVVNHKVTTDPRGKVTTTPLTTDEVEKLTALVKETIGFKQDRGDSVKVVNAPFRTDPKADEQALPLWKQPEVLDILRTVAVPGALAVIALLAFFGLIRPGMKAAMLRLPPPGPMPSAPIVTAVVDEPAAALPQLPAPQRNIQLEQARMLAQTNPAAVAGIVRGWVNGNAAQA